jgi:hypothetical protein
LLQPKAEGHAAAPLPVLMTVAQVTSRRPGAARDAYFRCRIFEIFPPETGAFANRPAVRDRLW